MGTIVSRCFRGNSNEALRARIHLQMIAKENEMVALSRQIQEYTRRIHKVNNDPLLSPIVKRSQLDGLAHELVHSENLYRIVVKMKRALQLRGFTIDGREQAVRYEKDLRKLGPYLRIGNENDQLVDFVDDLNDIIGDGEAIATEVTDATEEQDDKVHERLKEIIGTPTTNTMSNSLAQPHTSLIPAQEHKSSVVVTSHGPVLSHSASITASSANATTTLSKHTSISPQRVLESLPIPPAKQTMVVV